MSAFVVEKDTRDCYLSFNVYMSPKRYVRIYIWNSKTGLYRNTRFKTKSYGGAYVAYPRRMRKGLFGEIHFVRENVTARVVAHEVEHLVQDWVCSGFPPNHVFTSEKIAYFCGDFTAGLYQALIDNHFLQPRVAGRRYLRMPPS